MPRASYNGQTIAETDTHELVEGNVYFPPDSVDRALLEPSEHTTVCGWKGTARYYHVVVDGQRNENAAWYYPEPKEAAANIKDHVAFWRGVTVER
ncbi:MAG: DUF427 domain-containing protein [Myxococcales bacterium]|nr:DUF427 domain-containing protein [Myxococcales bacterium]